MGDQVQVCTNCQKDVSVLNFELHAIHCQRNIIICERCSEPVSRIDIESHINISHALVSCEKCNMQMELWQADDHKDRCIKRPVACVFCEVDCAWDEIKDHEEFCGSRTEPCEHCKKRILRKDWENHKRACEESSPHTKILVTCPSCGLMMDHELEKIHLALCAKSSKNAFRRNVIPGMNQNRWDSNKPSEGNLEADSVSSIVESLSKLTTSDRPVSPSEDEEKARYEPMAPILSVSKSKNYQAGVSHKINSRRTVAFFEREKEEEIQQDEMIDENDVIKGESISSVIQKLRVPLNNNLQPSLHESTLPEEILSRQPTFPEEIPPCQPTFSEEIPSNQSALLGEIVSQESTLSEVLSHESTLPKEVYYPSSSNNYVDSALPKNFIYPSTTIRSGKSAEGLRESRYLALEQPSESESINIEELKVDCPICKNSISVNELSDHVKSCSRSKAPNICPICHIQVSQRDKDNHINNCKQLQMAAAQPSTGDSRKKKKKDKKKENASNPQISDWLNAHRQAVWDLENALAPCEFCSKPFPMVRLIEHQSGCRPDLLQIHPGQSSEAQADGNENPDVLYNAAESNQGNHQAKFSADSLHSRKFDGNKTLQEVDQKLFNERNPISQNSEASMGQIYQKREGERENQSAACGSSFRSDESTFRKGPSKRRGTNYTRSSRFDYDAVPGEFIFNQRFVGFPDCYQLYQKVPIPPPFPRGIMFFDSTLDQGYGTPAQPSYAEVAQSSHKNGAHYHHKEKRWRKGSVRNQQYSSDSESDSSRQQKSSNFKHPNKYSPQKSKKGKKTSKRGRKKR